MSGRLSSEPHGGHIKKLDRVLSTAETDHLLLRLHNAPDHAVSIRSSCSPVVSTAATTLMSTVKEIAL